MSLSATSVADEEIVDPLEHMLKKTGCINFHYQLQECFAKTQDWRQCQTQVKEFKDCMDVYRKELEKKYMLSE